MASLAEKKAAAASQGAQAPAGYPGGPDAWVNDWYQNAVNAGSIQDASTPYTQGQATATDATTGATPQGRKNTGTSQFADMIRAKAKAEGWSEDFERFSDAQIDAWQQYWDPQAGRFRSENDPTGAATYDKPAECPPGTTFHGSKCVSWSQLPPELGGTLGQGGGQAGPGGQPAPGSAQFDPRNPLQQGLVNLYQERGGMFSGQQAGGFGDELSGGGVFWGEGGQGAVNPALTAAALNAFTPAAPSQQQGAKPAGGGMETAQSGGSMIKNAATAPVSSAFAGGFTGQGQSPTGMIGALQQGSKAAQATPGGAPLEKALAGKFKDPNAWWKGDNAGRLAV